VSMIIGLKWTEYFASDVVSCRSISMLRVRKICDRQQPPRCAARASGRARKCRSITER
jgi:hypothetical protein